MPQYISPAVYVEDEMPRSADGPRTGIPVFLGLTDSTPEQIGGIEAFAITCWTEFQQKFGNPATKEFLSYAVRGFFQNDGQLCYVYPLKNDGEIFLRKALERLESWETFDLICAPDLMLNPSRAIAQQRAILDYCEKRGDCFAILDSLPGSNIEEVLRQRHTLNSPDGALYYPWLSVNTGPTSTAGLVPACGHIAGIYARSDKQNGVHKAPANEAIEGVIDLEFEVSGADQECLNPYGVNSLRLFMGRGIRVWGARTLSGSPEWRYINVRRLFKFIGRWCEQNLADVVFEPNQSGLWDYIKRALNAYLTEIYRNGALQGSSPNEAFYVRCDAQTNSPEVREQGIIVTEIGLAVAVPSEFVVVRIIHHASGISTTGSIRES